jgi:hypothetical protein
MRRLLAGCLQSPGSRKPLVPERRTKLGSTRAETAIGGAETDIGASRGFVTCLGGGKGAV